MAARCTYCGELMQPVVFGQVATREQIDLDNHTGELAVMWDSGIVNRIAYCNHCDREIPWPLQGEILLELEAIEEWREG